MQKFAKKYLNVFAWVLSALVVGIAIVAWGQRVDWQLVGISNYQLFPLFGLLAFSLMWAGYVVSGIKSAFNVEDIKLSKLYFQITAAAVFGAILIHPSLLVVQLWRDGFGLPPGSYRQYVAPGTVWFVYLGTVAWLAFMSYELRRFYANKSWWKYVLYANDIAIWAVYIHAFNLGVDIASSWLRVVWIIYGICLALAFVAIYRKRFAVGIKTWFRNGS